MPKANVPVLKHPVPSKKRGGRKVAVILFLLVLVLLCVLFFRSSFSKISEITFEGNTYLSNEELLEVAGVQVGDPYFGTSNGKIEGKLTEVPSIEMVTVDKAFPGKLHILVKEHPLVAYEFTGTDQLNGLLANGTKVPRSNGSTLMDKPILTGWDEADPYLPKLCAKLAGISDALLLDISEIVPSPTVSYPDRIKMYTRSGFEIISSIAVLQDKAEYMSMIMDSQDPGLLTLLEADTYVPFNADELQSEEENDTTHD